MLEYKDYDAAKDFERSKKSGGKRFVRVNEIPPRTEDPFEQQILQVVAEDDDDLTSNDAFGIWEGIWLKSSISQA